MSRNREYSLDFMLKIKQVNPNFQFTGKNKEIYEEFLERQKEESLMSILNEEPEKPKKAKRVKKTKQVIERKNTESLDFFVENEVKEEPTESV